MTSARNAMTGIRRGLGLLAVALLVWGCGGDGGNGDGDGDGDGGGPACEEEQFAAGELPEADSSCRCVGQQVTGVVDGCTINCFCTSNGWVCTDSCGGTQQGPELGFGSEPALLLLDGDGNEVSGADPQADGVAPGSRLRLVVELALASGQAAEQVEVRILNEPTRVEFRGSRNRMIQRVDSDTPGTAEFEFDIRPSATAGPLSIEMEARGLGTNTLRRNVTFDVVLTGPVLEWGTMRWLDPQDAEGDPVPFLERGETYNLSGMLRNTGTEPASDISFQVLVDTVQFEVVATPPNIASLPAGEGVPVDATLRVQAGANQESTDVTLIASAAGAVTADRIITASIDTGGGGGTVSLEFDSASAMITADSSARRLVTIGDNECSPLVAEGPTPQGAGNGTFSVDVTNTGSSSADLAWTATSLPTCVPSDFVNPDDAEDTDYISPSCARGIFGCNAGPDIDQVDGPATLAAGASGTVTVTFSITDVTADRSAIRLEAQTSSGTTSRVFDQDGERIER